MAVPQVDTSEVNDFVNKNGVKGVNRFIKKQFDKWQSIPLNVAITGSGGAGKSSYINAIRNMTADDAGAAAVGVVETTMEPTPYAHPANPQLQLWDLPGVGTLNFPKETYLTKMNFSRFDFFLIISKCRFTENDMWLAKEVRRLKKTFFFVRTHIDEDIANDKLSHPHSHKDDVDSKVRANCIRNLCEMGIDDAEVFLISNFHSVRWDFPALTDRLLECLPEEKRQAMAMTLTTLTIKVIKEKRAYLQRFALLAAAASGGVGAIPIPGVSVVADTGIILMYLTIYKQQFGLDEETLQNVAESTKSSLDTIKQLAKTATTIAAHTIPALFAKYVVSEVAEEVVRYVIPIIGCGIAAAISFGTTYKMLLDVLDKLEKEAIDVLEYAINETK